MSGLSFNEISLVADPRFLNIDNLVLKLLGLLKNIILFGFHWTGVLINALVFQLSVHSVKLVYLKLSLLNSIMSLLNVCLKLGDLVLFLLELSNKIIELFLQEIVLLDTVEIINSDSRDFV